MTEASRYRIQTVAEMTGISAATLRQWERRYGMPAPGRSASAYRVYGPADIDAIRRVKSLCAGGMSPSDAAALVRRELEDAAHASETTARPQSVMPVVTPPAESVDANADPWLQARQRLLDAVERYDLTALTEATSRLQFLGGAVAVHDRVIAPVMREVGQRWQDGTFSVAQEHLASEALTRALQHLTALVQPDDSAPRVLLACFGDELHSLPLYGVALCLAPWNLRAVVLGARTPPAALAHAVAHLRPKVIGLSVTISPEPEAAEAVVQAYGRACAGVPWVVGGRGARLLAGPIIAAGGQIAPLDPRGLQTMIHRLATGADREDRAGA
ncbi:MAG: B12-binding domain-containing protein [Myxococcales bacterium]|nr:B12-binding domain-containing protein [Myxococcales bacterium]